MGELSFFIEDLNKSAKASNDSELINKVESKSFEEALESVCKVLGDLNYEIVKKSEDINFQKEIYLKISRGLIENYFVMYYANIKTNEYIGYTNSTEYQLLKIAESGNDFFKDIIKNAKMVIYKDDFEYVIGQLSKEKLIKETENGQTYIFKYRLMLDNKPTYVALKAVRLIDDPDNLIIGVTNVDMQTRKELEIRKLATQNINYNNIAVTLARDYFVIYYVDVNTSNYIQYSLNNDNQTLIVDAKGNDFFADSLMNARRYIAPEDQDKFMKAILKESILNELSNEPVFRLTYRQIISNKPTYVAMKCMKITSDSSHIIIAVSNIDTQQKKENEYIKKLTQERNLARTDALTGASNKFSYNELEKEINKHIDKKSMDQFAVVICDINNLKIINDTLGHDVGDEYIKEAKNILCTVFKTSTVFRVGGDEFVSVLDGNDYYTRDYLLQKLKDINEENHLNNKVTIACGMSDYNPDEDKRLVDVFRRADELMYQDKKEQKARHHM